MRYLFLILVLCISTLAKSQITTFQRTFPAANEEFVGTLTETTEHNFLVGGNTDSFGAGLSDAFIMLTDSNGIASWSFAYGDNLTQHILDIFEEDANNIFFTGYTETSINGEDAIFGKIDGSGNLLFTNCYGGSGDETTRKILRDSSDNFYLVGFSSSEFAGVLNDVYVIKLNSNGDLIWSKAYGEAGNDMARSAQIDSNGDIIIVGYSDSFSANKDGLVMKIDTAGTVLWSRRFESDKADLLQNLVIDTSDNIMITGFTKMNLNYTSSFYNPLLLKLDSDGNQDWLMIYEDSVQTKGFSISAGLDSGYVIAADGFEIVAQDDTMNCVYIRTNDNGNIIWSKAIGGAGDEWRPQIIPTSDGGYLAGTNTTTFTTDTMNNIYLIKMDMDGESGCNTTDYIFDEIDTTFVQDTVIFITANGGVETNLTWTTNIASFVEDTLCEDIFVDIENIESETKSQLVIYPNPTSGKIKVETDAFIKMEVLDIRGKHVCTSKEDKVDIGNMPKGIYIIKVTSKTGIAVGKLILE